MACTALGSSVARSSFAPFSLIPTWLVILPSSSTVRPDAGRERTHLVHGEARRQAGSAARTDSDPCAFGRIDRSGADLDDAPEQEVEDAEARILDQATAARSIVELKAELDTLKVLESLALGVRRRSADTKWRELASLLGEIFTATGRDGRTGEPAIRDGDGAIPRPAASPHQKLVVFTEHRDTLRYLQERITTLLGRQTSVVVIHGSVGREERLAAQEAFRHDPQVQVLLATDAAGEGHQPAARPPDGQLRLAVEPEPPGTALRPHPPDWPDRGLSSVESGRRRDPRR